MRSFPGLQRVLRRHVHCPSLDLLLGPSLARIAGGFFKFFLSFPEFQAMGLLAIW